MFLKPNPRGVRKKPGPFFLKQRKNGGFLKFPFPKNQIFKKKGPPSEKKTGGKKKAIPPPKKWGPPPQKKEKKLAFPPFKINQALFIKKEKKKLQGDIGKKKFLFWGGPPALFFSPG